MQESLPVFNSMSEIAEYLGITKVSVSLALKNSPLISDELRKQVQQLPEPPVFLPGNIGSRRGIPPPATPSRSALTPSFRAIQSLRSF